MIYPRILIFGQVFNKKSGGGITLTNLFNGWDKDKIAVLALGHELFDATNDVCDIFYQLGDKEHKWIFPFNLLQRKFSSGLKKIDNHLDRWQELENPTFRSTLVNKVLYPFLDWIGIFHSASTIRLSADLKKWLEKFNPEVLYLQVSSRESINFAKDLINHLRKPTIIHMMDDWPSTISSRGPFKNYWHEKIDREFKLLLDKIDTFLSISDAMSDEYHRRYHKTFRAFHNPVDIIESSSRISGMSSKKIINKVLYIGRIGTANRNSVSFFADFISELSGSAFVLEFHIYTKDIDDPEVIDLGRLKNVFLKSAVNHDEVYTLLQQYDVLLLPLDFTEMGLRFARFSIPTKASEYMFSGTPILVFAPEETAVVQFFKANDCGCCVTELSNHKLKESFENILSNDDYRLRLVRNAVNIARDRFDGEKVRSEFHNLLIKTVKNFNPN